MRFIKICAGVFALASILISVSYMLRQSGPKGTAEFVEALEDAPINSVIRLSDYISFQASEVCLLTPYQYRIPPKNSQHASEINEKIRKVRLGSDDALWNVVLWKTGKIEVIELTRYLSSEIKSKDFGEVEHRLFSRVTFLQKPCSDFSSAAFIKFKSDDQTFLAFGGA